MSELGHEFKDGRIGPVPVWAAAVGLAGAFVAFMFFRNRNKGSQASPPVADSGQALIDTGAYASSDGLPAGAIGDYLDQNPMDPAYPVGLNSNGIPGPITNVQWTRLAFDHLIGLGNDPELVERALAKYIGNLSLTQAERSIVNLAQTAFGAPPEGLIIPGDPTPTPTPDPTPTPTPTPTPQYSTVQVGEGNWVSWVVDSVKAYKPDYTEAQLRADNPNVYIAQANDNGYISATNPNRGFSRSIFNVGSPTNVKVPARP